MHMHVEQSPIGGAGAYSKIIMKFENLRGGFAPFGSLS